MKEVLSLIQAAWGLLWFLSYRPTSVPLGSAPRSSSGVHKLTRLRNILSLLIAVGWGVCGTCYADAIIGSPGAGFQTWTAGDVNNNNAPYWDYPTNYTSPPSSNGNVGFCLTTGCAGQLSPGPAPGAIPFWGLSYNQLTDTGGSKDPQFFFQRQAAPETLSATLEVSLAKFGETNSFGWFETNSAGSIIGNTHQLFSANDALGTTTTFQPTPFFGYYFQDISENCFVYTLSLQNTGICGPGGIEPLHEFAAFAANPTFSTTAFWLAGLDHNAECTPGGGADCNLTVVEVEQVSAPEPTTVLLLATGLMGLLFVKSVRRRNRNTVQSSLPAQQKLPWRWMVGTAMLLATTTPHAWADLYVNSNETGQVLQYNQTTGAFVGVFAHTSGDPEGLAVSSTGNLYVGVTGNLQIPNQVQAYTPGGSLITSTTFNMGDPRGLAFGPNGDLFVADRQNVLELNPLTLGLVKTFVTSGTGGLLGPSFLTFGPNGDLFVQSGNGQVLEYNGMTGAFVKAFVTAGSGGQPIDPQGLAFGPNGNLFVVDDGLNFNVLEFDGTTGAFVTTFVPRGSGGLSEPYNLAFGPNGNLFVDEFKNAADVLEYNGITGAFVTTFVAPNSGGLTDATGMAFGPNLAAPEPSTSLLLGTALVGLLGVSRWRRRYGPLPRARGGAFEGLFTANSKLR